MPKIDPYKLAFRFTGNDDLRPAMKGVYHKGGYIYATDGHVLLKMKADYPKSREGKILDKNMQPVKSDGQIITKFPNAEAVIPDSRKMDLRKVNVNDIEKALKEVMRIKEEDFYSWGGKKRKNNRKKWIMFVPKEQDLKELKASSYAQGSFGEKIPGTKGLATFHAYFFKRSILPFMKETGADEMYLDKNLSDSRACIVKKGNDTALIMPMLNSNPTYFPKEEYDVQVVRTNPVKQNTNFPGKKTVNKQQKPNTMTKKRTTAKTHGSSTTMRDASRILKAQKDDYKKIFAAEVKKSKDPKAGAKKAGKIYRDRYGATATARWKRAIKRAK